MSAEQKRTKGLSALANYKEPESSTIVGYMYGRQFAVLNQTNKINLKRDNNRKRGTPRR